ncbi:MAG: YetF domain-containing protein [Acidimicrobiales bacterium]
MEIVLRASVVFFFLLLLTRGLKRRTLADMAPFEMILLVVVGDIVQQGVTQEDFSLTGAVLATSTFAFWVTVLSYVSWRWIRFGRIIDGIPIVIVQDGRPVIEALRVERLPIDEVLEAARQDGIDSLEKVRLAVLEPSGRISFIKEETAP